MTTKYKIILSSIFTLCCLYTNAQKKKYRSITELSMEEIQKLRDRRSIQFEASEHTEKYQELGITIMRDTTHQKDFDSFKQRLSQKLTEINIPHKFFIEIIDHKKGAAFAYFIEGRQYGVFNFKEFVALLPEMVSDYKKAFPKIVVQSDKQPN